MTSLGWFLRARLQRRLFLWFGATILITSITVAVVMSLVGGGGEPWHREVERVRTFVGGRFERAWDVPAEREALAAAMARDLDLDVRLLDGGRGLLASYGGSCDKPGFEMPVARGSSTLGYLQICVDRHGGFKAWRLILPLLLAGIMLWGASGRLARRLAQPLAELARVAREIGAGNLGSRARLRWYAHGEVGALGEVINDMAARIERQIADQRELLALVSHELRTPLARIRILVELARQSGTDGKTLDEIDREVMEIDNLVGELLASSRLDFTALTVSQLDPLEVARRALERSGADASLLAVEGAPPAKFGADATLVARALANLIVNAQTHGAGLRALRVRARPGFVAFEADDAGAGFTPGEERRVFDAFYRRAQDAERDAGSLGLGLALVKRIAEAHKGSAFAANRPEGGARVGVEFPAG